MPIVVNLGAKLLIPLLVSWLGLNVLFLNPDYSEITNHKIINSNTIEYQGVIRVNGKEEKFKYQVEFLETEKGYEKHQKDFVAGRIQIYRKGSEMNFSVDGVDFTNMDGMDKDDKDRLWKLIEDTVKYNSRIGLRHKIAGKLTDGLRAIRLIR